jgi:multiple sugar transport system ATP-binding protein
MNVAENISFALEMRKVPRAERQAKVQKVAELLQIEHLLDRRPAQLSGGQRQRVAMGRALAREPQLFLFDEPLSNLDAKLRVEMRAEIKLLHQRTRTTTVYVTHDQVEAMTLGDRIAVMKDGQVQQFGTPHDIYTRPATVFVAEFIGSPAINWIAAQRGDGGLVAKGQALSLTPELGARLPAGDCLYGLRPEALQLSAQGLPGRVHMIEPTGPETYVCADTPLGRLTARVPGEVSEVVGDVVHLQWRAEAVHLFEAASQRRVA